MPRCAECLCHRRLVYGVDGLPESVADLYGIDGAGLRSCGAGIETRQSVIDGEGVAMKRLLIALLVLLMALSALAPGTFGQRRRHRRVVHRYYYIRPYRVRRY